MRLREPIFDKLYKSARDVGPSHVSKEDALKDIPSHDIGAAKEIIEEAIKEGF